MNSRFDRTPALNSRFYIISKASINVNKSEVCLSSIFKLYTIFETNFDKSLLESKNLKASS